MRICSFIGSGTVLAFECTLPHVAATFLREDIDERRNRLIGTEAAHNVTRRREV